MESDRDRDGDGDDFDREVALLASQERLNGHAAEVADDGDDVVWGIQQ